MKVLASLYLAISLLVGTLGWMIGDYSYKSFWYNLGRGITWPTYVFTNSTEVDGSTPLTFNNTTRLMQLEHKNPEGNYLFTEAYGYIAYYFYAKHTPSVTNATYKKMVSSGSLPNNFVQSLLTNEAIISDVMEYMDGMSFTDVIDEKEEMQEKIADLLKDRKEPVQVTHASSSEPIVATSYSDPEICKQAKLFKFRATNGPEAVVTADMLNEWEQSCAK